MSAAEFFSAWCTAVETLRNPQVSNVPEVYVRRGNLPRIRRFWAEKCGEAWAADVMRQLRHLSGDVAKQRAGASWGWQ